MPHGAHAAYPERPITVVVGFPAGGGTDLVARGVQRALERAIGGQIVVKNVPGAAATIGTTEVSRAAPDGYTLLATPSTSMVLQPHRMRLTYTPASFAPVCMTTDTPLLVLTTKGSPFKTAADVVTAAKAKPGKVPYGSPGAGSAFHVGMATFLRAAKIQLKHVPFKGTADVIQGLLSGTVGLAIGQPNTVEQYQLVPLAVTAAQRLPEFPDVPTAKEAIGTEAVASIWNGLFAPAGTPQAIVDKLEAACKAALADPETIELFARQKQPLHFMGQAEFKAFIAKEYESARVLVDELGLKSK